LHIVVLTAGKDCSSRLRRPICGSGCGPSGSRV